MACGSAACENDEWVGSSIGCCGGVEGERVVEDTREMRDDEAAAGAGASEAVMARLGVEPFCGADVERVRNVEADVEGVIDGGSGGTGGASDEAKGLWSEEMEEVRWRTSVAACLSFREPDEAMERRLGMLARALRAR